jgi:UDP-perosamine 4-acetyltransferase
MRVLILGAGAHGGAIADLIGEGAGLTVVGFSDADPTLAGRRVLGLPVLGDDAAALEAVRAGRADGALVGVGNTALAARRRLFELLAARGIPAPTVVHPRAVVARSASIGEGAVVFAGVVVGARARIGANAVLYSGAIVEHDSVVEPHAYLGPGVVLAGAVTVGEGAFLGAGAVVLPGVEIGRDALVAAGAVVTASVGAAERVGGVPARLLPASATL